MIFEINEKGEARVEAASGNYFIPSQFLDIDHDDEKTITDAIKVFEDFGIIKVN